jgi:hypothetical protein
MHTCNPRTWEAEAGGSPDGGQLGIHSQSLSQKKKKKVGASGSRLWLCLLATQEAEIRSIVV